MSLAATYFGANGWLLEFGSYKVLLDPWLTGELSFPPGPWLLKGKLPHDWAVPENLDLLLLSQGLPDHAHPETLQLLSRDLQIVCSPSAAKVVKRLGFNQVHQLHPGESTCVASLTIRASAGAMVPSLENGYLLNHPAGKIYLEPHGFLDKQLEAQMIDAVITPVVDLGLPLAGAFLKGRQVLPELLTRFKPQTVLASTAGGDVRFEGLLSRFMQMEGSPEEITAMLPAQVNLIDPEPGKRYALNSNPSLI
jgi:L-ascorbate metabolism protein UlaG (beta-lactamase superfamily)